MERINHLAYCRADEPFYESNDTARTGSPFPATERPAPPGWRRTESSVWLYVHPEHVRLPAQGWKIHVSATASDAAEVIDTVWDYCVSRSLSFKFLPHPQVHRAMNAKYAPRGSSGKLITLYPVDEADLKRTLDDLDPLLAGRPGPYILSDLRWREGPLYLRYGGFARRECLTENGDRSPAVSRPDGVLVPDERTPVFQVPDWAPVPGFVAAQIDARDAAQDDPAFPYTVERALHYSNGGGVYLATDDATGRQVVLREARPLAGLDGAGDDAVTRLHREAATLRRLAHLDCVPELLGTFTAWEHHFLVQEYIEGETLQRFTATANPLVRPHATAQERQEYADRALDVLDQLERVLEAVHATGTVFGDLSPTNVMVRPDGRVALVDFEISYRPDAGEAVPSIGTPGYVAAHATGFDRDRYALDCLRLSLFLPLTMTLELDPARAGQLAEAATRLFDLPEEFPSRVRAGLTPPGVTARTDRSVPELFAATAADPASEHARELEERLVAAIRSAATPERTDRLFPGDPAALHDGGYTLAHGAAGVLYALAATGHPTDPEHHEWLWQATHRATGPRPGLYDGLHGAAYTLHLVGRTAQALEVLDRAIDLTDDAAPIGLHDGLAGIGLNLRHFARALDEPGLHAHVLDTGDRLAARLATVTRTPARSAGLLRGWSGPALFFVSLYEDTGEERYLDLARQSLQLDLDHCLEADSVLNLNDGRRLLPYLGQGSAGIALALHAYLLHRPDEQLDATLESLHAATELSFTIQSGLFLGRAGLAAALAHNRAAEDNPRRTAALTGHVRDLAWHALDHEGGIATTGDQNLRLSMDLATGSAGILHTLHAVAGRLPALPLLDRPGAPARTPRAAASATAPHGSAPRGIAPTEDPHSVWACEGTEAPAEAVRASAGTPSKEKEEG
ncbi:class III lanthionine synthetase LanKC [Streptomyces sp. NPDC057499]|uniref:class III lanthionine synthetase LanKC n=1 Tax=Streptomyces sp. NPDC057499 TaxID=3346150 RepID=UPI0036BCF365